MTGIDKVLHALPSSQKAMSFVSGLLEVGVVICVGEIDLRENGNLFLLCVLFILGSLIVDGRTCTFYPAQHQMSTVG